MTKFTLQHPTNIISLGRLHREQGKRCIKSLNAM